MELEGMIVMDLPMQEGVSKAGRPWRKKEWVLETPGMYPRRVMFHVFGERIDSMPFEVGKSYSVSIELQSREFNGRWYTDVSALAMRPIEGVAGAMMGGYPQQPAANFGAQPAAGYVQPAQPAQPAQPFQPQQPAVPSGDPFAGQESPTDDLPF